MYNFKNHNIVVTGGTRGIGKSISLKMANCGASVLITGTKKEHKTKHKNISYIKVDFNIDSELQYFLNILYKSEFDICINNAGINIKHPIISFDDEDWDRVININLSSSYKIIKNVSRNMIKNNYGKIINISSLWGTLGAPNRAAYSCSKHALNGLTKTAASELSKHNILVNSVSPGFVLTSMTLNSLTEEKINKLKTKIPLGRLATPDEIAEAVCFLSSRRNTYINAQNIIIDGGFSGCSI